MRKFSFKWLLLICFFVGLGLNIKNIINAGKVRYYDIIDVSSWIQKKAIIERGDTIAYHHVVDSIKSDSNIPHGNYFFYSVVMATKYDYVPANFDAFSALVQTCNHIDSLDPETKRLAYSFLYRGAKYGDKRCQSWIKSHKLK